MVGSIVIIWSPLEETGLQTRKTVVQYANTTLLPFIGLGDMSISFLKLARCHIYEEAWLNICLFSF